MRSANRLPFPRRECAHPGGHGCASLHGRQSARPHTSPGPPHQAAANSCPCRLVLRASAIRLARQPLRSDPDRDRTGLLLAPSLDLPLFPLHGPPWLRQSAQDQEPGDWRGAHWEACRALGRWSSFLQALQAGEWALPPTTQGGWGVCQARRQEKQAAKGSSWWLFLLRLMRWLRRGVVLATVAPTPQWSRSSSHPTTSTPEFRRKPPHLARLRCPYTLTPRAAIWPPDDIASRHVAHRIHAGCGYALARENRRWRCRLRSSPIHEKSGEKTRPLHAGARTRM